MAQNENAQAGLVNVNVQTGDIAIPVAVAANVCDVDVNVLAVDLSRDGRAFCKNDVDQTLRRAPRAVVTKTGS